MQLTTSLIQILGFFGATTGEGTGVVGDAEVVVVDGVTLSAIGVGLKGLIAAGAADSVCLGAI